jgi:hypothetical protein
MARISDPDKWVDVSFLDVGEYYSGYFTAEVRFDGHVKYLMHDKEQFAECKDTQSVVSLRTALDEVALATMDLRLHGFEVVD